MDAFRVQVFVMNNKSSFISRTIEYHYPAVNWRSGPSVFRHFEDHFRLQAGDQTLSLWRFAEDDNQNLPSRSEDIAALQGMRAPPLTRIGTKDFGGDSDPDLQEESRDLEVYVKWCRQKYKGQNTVFFWAYPRKPQPCGNQMI
jgi:hypothetical protein